MNLTRSVKHVGLVLAVTLVYLVAALFPAAGAAADITLPEEFYGDITINGLSAPVGTVIAARVGDVERGSFTTTESGKYGGPGTFDSRLVVVGEEAEIGETITFWVNSTRANQTAVYEPGESKELNLSAQAYPLNAGDTQITVALNYLRGQQQADGRIAAFGTSAWAVMAIAAAGEDPNTWAAGGNSIVDYLRDNTNHLNPSKATDWERSILAIVAAGENPRDFGGIDYVTTLLDFYDGTQIGDNTMLNDDFWGILALAAIGESQTILQNVRTFIKANQNADGGWGWTVGGNSDADNTGAAISALVAAGESPGSQAITSALDYLKSQQQNNGGFVSEGTTNSAVDSWVINAITDVGQSPTGDEWRKSGNNPVGHLLDLQDADGAFKWTAALRSNPEWMTAYALPALLGKSWPKDTLPPAVSNLSPSPGASVSTTNPVVGASYSDTVSGIDETTARILLDGTDLTASATVAASSISYTTAGLTPGTHSVRVAVNDKAGNGASQSWSFRVVAGGGGGGGGGLGGSGSPPGATDVSNVIGSDGIFTQGITAESEDGKCVLTVNAGIRGLTRDGGSLEQITLVEMETPPTPPEQSSVIGIVYDLGPDGATFDPPIDLTFSYDESLIPEGVTEENLVVALWDSETDEWVELVCVIDPENNTITAEVSHFTIFSILAGTRPAAFTASDLSITPVEVYVGESASISVLATNTGDLTGSYEVSLKIDNITVEIKEVTLAGGNSEMTSFSITRDAVGTHTVNVGGLSGAFEVKAAPPVTPEQKGAESPLPPAPPEPSAKPINWPVLGGVIAGVIVVGLLIFFTARRTYY